jgi:hypothetical protein
MNDVEYGEKNLLPLLGSKPGQAPSPSLYQYNNVNTEILRTMDLSQFYSLVVENLKVTVFWGVTLCSKNFIDVPEIYM